MWIKSQIKDIVSDQKMGWPYTCGHSSIPFLPQTTFPYFSLQFDKSYIYET